MFQDLRLDLRRVEEIPEDLRPGIFYYSEKYHTATHLCPCGCGNKVVTPIHHEGEPDCRRSWKLHISGDCLVTLSPSVGCFDLPCNSHYWIRSSLVSPCY